MGLKEFYEEIDRKCHKTRTAFHERSGGHPRIPAEAADGDGLDLAALSVSISILLFFYQHVSINRVMGN